MIRIIGFLILVAVLGAAAVGISAYAPYKGFDKDVFLDFPKGTSTRAMAGELTKQGVIRYPWQFLAARALRPSAKLQAGEYRFNQPASPMDVFARIARGDVYYYEISVPEGTNLFDISAIVERSGIVKTQDFLEVARKPKLIQDLDPKATSLEGYLFPSTYRITRRTTAEQLCKQMTDQFRKEWKAAAKPGADIHETITLASIVEKESGVAEERPKVASVYHNRLKIGMKLDADPTTIYAAILDDRYRGVIHQSDLASQNPYNTYQHTGLPPGPIANPGAASIKAALAPAETDYIYFVAKPNGAGSHNFAADYAGHERNVQEYRRALKAAH